MYYALTIVFIIGACIGFSVGKTAQENIYDAERSDRILQKIKKKNEV